MIRFYHNAIEAARADHRARRALVWKCVALQHQLAVLQRSGTRRPRFCPIDRLFWVFMPWWSPAGATHGKSFNPKRSCAGASRYRVDSIDHVVPGIEGHNWLGDLLSPFRSRSRRASVHWMPPTVLIWIYQRDRLTLLNFCKPVAMSTRKATCLGSPGGNRNASIRSANTSPVLKCVSAR
jgi:hypothetical protein